MSRTCHLCPRSSMRDHVVHLHELLPGAEFFFEDEPAVRWKLVSGGTGSCVIEGKSQRVVRRFTPRFGDQAVEFETVRRGTRSCTSVAQVVVIPAMAEVAL